MRRGTIPLVIQEVSPGEYEVRRGSKALHSGMLDERTAMGLARRNRDGKEPVYSVQMDGYRYDITRDVMRAR